MLRLAAYYMSHHCMQDVKSYVNVGIPESRIFTVNHKVRCMGRGRDEREGG